MSEFTDSPYKTIPEELKNGYTMGGKIPVLNWWLDGRNNLHKKNWNEDYLKSFTKRFTERRIKSNQEGNSPYGHHSVISLLISFKKYNLENKKIAVIGSVEPWIESILLNLNNKVTTIEYNVPEVTVPNLCAKNYFNDFKDKKGNYDAIVTYSSIEHSGLGRYGDPLDPDGDIKTMEDIYKNLKQEGILIWGAPVGKDALVWNVHRVYGKIRLPILFKNFLELDWIGFSKNILNNKLANNGAQPVIVLKKSKFKQININNSYNIDYFKQFVGNEIIKDNINIYQENIKEGKSQNGEDGLLIYIFSKLKTIHKYAVEFGGGDGEWLSNIYYFRKKLGWDYLLLEENKNQVNKGNRNGVKNLYHENVTQENINNLFEKYNVPENFDLLSIDIDSLDYFILKNLNTTKFRPSIIIIETNPGLPNEIPLTVDDSKNSNPGIGYFGTNLLAAYDLANEKGYKFVTTVRWNAIFIRKELFEELEINSISREECIKNYFKPSNFWISIIAKNIINIPSFLTY